MTNVSIQRKDYYLRRIVVQIEYVNQILILKACRQSLKSFLIIYHHNSIYMCVCLLSFKASIYCLLLTQNFGDPRKRTHFCLVTQWPVYISVWLLKEEANMKGKRNMMSTPVIKSRLQMRKVSSDTKTFNLMSIFDL